MQIENTSDYLPITLELNYPTSSLDTITDDFASGLASNPKIDWSKFSQEKISKKHITPLVNQLENINIAEYYSILMIMLKQLLIYCCRTQSHLQKRTAKQIKRIKVLLDSLRKLRWLDIMVRLPLMIGNNLISHLRVMLTTYTMLKVKIIVPNVEIF